MLTPYTLMTLSSLILYYFGSGCILPIFLTYLYITSTPITMYILVFIQNILTFYLYGFTGLIFIYGSILMLIANLYMTNFNTNFSEMCMQIYYVCCSKDKQQSKDSVSDQIDQIDQIDQLYDNWHPTTIYNNILNNITTWKQITSSMLNNYVICYISPLNLPNKFFNLCLMIDIFIDSSLVKLYNYVYKLHASDKTNDTIIMTYTRYIIDKLIIPSYNIFYKLKQIPEVFSSDKIANDYYLKCMSDYSYKNNSRNNSRNNDINGNQFSDLNMYYNNPKYTGNINQAKFNQTNSKQFCDMSQINQLDINNNLLKLKLSDEDKKQLEMLNQMFDNIGIDMDMMAKNMATQMANAYQNKKNE